MEEAKLEPTALGNMTEFYLTSSHSYVESGSQQKKASPKERKGEEKGPLINSPNSPLLH